MKKLKIAVLVSLVAVAGYLGLTKLTAPKVVATFENEMVVVAVFDTKCKNEKILSYAKAFGAPKADMEKMTEARVAVKDSKEQIKACVFRPQPDVALIVDETGDFGIIQSDQNGKTRIEDGPAKGKLKVGIRG